jgi:hypothetical protein
MSTAHFLAPRVLFFSLSWLPLHFLQRFAEIGFLPPHLKHTLKKSLRCWAICFLAASVIGINIDSVLQGLFLSLLLMGKLFMCNSFVCTHSNYMRVTVDPEQEVYRLLGFYNNDV